MKRCGCWGCSRTNRSCHHAPTKMRSRVSIFFQMRNDSNREPWIPAQFVLIFGVLGIVSIVSAFYLCSPWSDLAINLAAGFITIGATTWWIDRALHQHRERQWKSVAGQARNRACSVAAAVVLSVRVKYGAGKHELGLSDDGWVALGVAYQGVARFARNRLIESVREHGGLNEERWKELSIELEEASADCDRLLWTFQGRIEPSLFVRLLGLQDSIAELLVRLRMFPEAATDYPHPPSEFDDSELRRRASAQLLCATALEVVVKRAAALLESANTGNDMTQPEAE